jgi:hypothetical protein
MKKPFAFVLAFIVVCTCKLLGQGTGGPIVIRIVESDSQEWQLEIMRDTSWHHYNIALSAFGSGSGFLNTPVTNLVVVPIGGGGPIGGPLTEVADWIDDVVIADSLIDDFDDGDFFDWFRESGLNGSYLRVVAERETPNASPHCMKIAHGNTMGQTFAGRVERRFAGWTLSPTDTLRLWLRGKSYLITDVPEAQAGMPREFALYQNYPNPFNPTTTISYQLPTNSHVTLKVFDVLGREVATLVDEVQEAGYKHVEFRADGLASGVYLYRLQAGGFNETKKMLVVR